MKAINLQIITAMDVALAEYPSETIKTEESMMTVHHVSIMPGVELRVFNGEHAVLLIGNVEIKLSFTEEVAQFLLVDLDTSEVIEFIELLVRNQIGGVTNEAA